jgi:molybdopterin biosynthesis enzyme
MRLAGRAPASSRHIDAERLSWSQLGGFQVVPAADLIRSYIIAVGDELQSITGSNAIPDCVARPPFVDSRQR